MNYQVDLNSDLGESFGAYTIGQDEQVLEFVSSANVACGYHAGDYNVMDKTVKLAKEKGVGIGAHPGFPDLAGFGRRKMEMTPGEVHRLVTYQIGAIEAFCRVHQVSLQHVKPHGALFNIASVDTKTAEAIAEAVYDVNPSLILFGLAGGELITAGKRLGLRCANEVFADRTYLPDGTLTPRSNPEALIHSTEEAVERVIKMITKKQTEALDGTVIDLEADTICVHGDKPEALEFVKHVRKVFSENNITVQPIGEWK
ncbi:LamB/YcsF family protein [Thalassorhabdus alkalitolerans]|uniref:5-oxoprolinase subunit A n=1 Tax=Thalassorhabdus alkalitolerans TaxID=2282697 RepID=A0ABW0YNX3_9BACI